MKKITFDVKLSVLMISVIWICVGVPGAVYGDTLDWNDCMGILRFDGFCQENSHRSLMPDAPGGCQYYPPGWAPSSLCFRIEVLQTLEDPVALTFISYKINHVCPGSSSHNNLVIPGYPLICGDILNDYLHQTPIQDCNLGNLNATEIERFCEYLPEGTAPGFYEYDVYPQANYDRGYYHVVVVGSQNCESEEFLCGTGDLVLLARATPTPTPTKSPLPTLTPTPTPIDYNRIRNPGFEEPGLSQWHVQGAGGLNASKDFSVAFEGQASCRLHKFGPTSLHSVLWQNIVDSVDPSRQYELKLWVRDQDTNGRVRAWIYYMDEFGHYTWISPYTEYSSDSSQWQLLRRVHKPPINSRKARVRIKIYNDNNQPATLHIDAVSYRLWRPSPTPTPTMTPTFTPTFTFTSTPSPTPEPPTPTPFPTPSCGENIILNASLEEWNFSGPGGPPDFWQYSAYSGFQVSRCDSVVYEGNFSGEVIKESKYNRDFYQEAVYPINPYSLHHFSVQLIDKTDSGRCRIFIRWRNETGAWLGNSYSAYSEDSPNWQALTVEADPPDEAWYATAVVRFYGYFETTQGIIDDFHFYEICSTPTPVPCPGDIGDVDLSGSITFNDCMLAYRIFTGEYDPTYCEEFRADANQNSIIDPEDVVCILQEVLGEPNNCFTDGVFTSSFKPVLVGDESPYLFKIKRDPFEAGILNCELITEEDLTYDEYLKIDVAIDTSVAMFSDAMEASEGIAQSEFAVQKTIDEGHKSFMKIFADQPYQVKAGEIILNFNLKLTENEIEGNPKFIEASIDDGNLSLIKEEII